MKIGEAFNRDRIMKRKGFFPGEAQETDHQENGRPESRTGIRCGEGGIRTEKVMEGQGTIVCKEIIKIREHMDTPGKYGTTNVGGM